MAYFNEDRIRELKVGAGFAAVTWVAISAFTSAFEIARRHKIITAVVIISYVLWHAVITGFGLNVINVDQLRNITESEYAAKHTASDCARGEGETFCTYDDGTSATYGVDGRMSRISIPTEDFTHTYDTSRKYYIYVLYRMGISDYYEPTTADMNGIVWRNIPNIREARLMTDDSMNANHLTVEFK